MIRIYFLKNCSYPIRLKRCAEFAEKLLKVPEVKKNICFFFTMENINNWEETETLEIALYQLMFQKEVQSPTIQLILINIKTFMIFLAVKEMFKIVFFN